MQQIRTNDVWEPLFKQIQRWAYRFLRGRCDSSSGLLQLAIDCAVVASEQLLTARFPYDTEVEAWACVLVQNVCRGYLRRERKVPDTLDDALIEHLSGLSQAEGEHRRKLQLELLDAIEQISSVDRRRIITLHYFQGLSLPEIARKMGRSMNATYKLHFDALAELGKIWGTKGHKDE